MITKAVTEYKNKFTPVSYTADMDQMGNEIHVDVIFNDTQAEISGIIRGKQQPDVSVDVDKNTMIADNNLFDHYYMAAKKFIESEKKEDKIELVIPMAATKFNAGFKLQEPSELTIAEKVYKAVNVNLSMGPSVISIAVDAKTHEMLKVAVPAQGFVILRKN